MKTLTELPGLNIKNAAKTRQDILTGGKTPEETPAALGEALRVEGDRLNLLVNALDVVGTKLNDLKRVVVYSLAEGEKAPTKAVQKGDHYYLVEYFPPLNPPKPSRHTQEDRPKGRRKRKRKRGERDGGRKRDFQASEGQPRGETQDHAGDQPRRERRRPRRVLPVQTQPPSGKPPVIIPKKPIQPKVVTEPNATENAVPAPESKTE
jgi:hypothetical protein